jgi:hypothetical protein
MLGAYLSIYGKTSNEAQVRASQREAPIGHDEASRGRIDVT